MDEAERDNRLFIQREDVSVLYGVLGEKKRWMERRWSQHSVRTLQQTM